MIPQRRVMAVLTTLTLLLPCPVQAQETAWKKLDREANELYIQGNYGDAAVVTSQALSVAEKTFGSDHPYLAKSLNGLAEIYRTQGQYAQAEPLYRRSLAILEKALGRDHPDVAVNLNNLAVLYGATGQYAQAVELYKRSLAIKLKVLSPDHPDVAMSLNNIAELYRTQGQYALAELLNKRSLGIRERVFGPDHPVAALSLNNLGVLYGNQGQYAQAEQLHKRALEIREKALGADHPDVAQSLNNLAEQYGIEGKYAQAEQLNKRALEIREKALGPNHLDVAMSLNNLAGLYRTQGQNAQAESLYMRALAIKEQTLGPNHPDVALGLNNLAVLYGNQGQFPQAESLHKRSMAIREKALGSNHPDVASSLHNLAGLYYKQGQYAQAEPLYTRSLAISEQALGPDHPDVASSLNDLVELHASRGQYTQALLLARRTSAIYKQRIVAVGMGDAAVREAVQNRFGFLNHLALLYFNPKNETSNKIADEALQIVQLEQASGTASAIAKMASRFSSGDDALASLIKRKQDASERRSRDETLLVSAASKPPQQRNAENEQRVRNDITSAAKEIEVIDTGIARRFPEYQELTRPEPASVSQVQALLKPGEAMLVYALSGRSFSFMWVVKQDGAIFQTLQVDAKDIAKKIATIRAEMEFDGNDRLKRVSVGVLHDLYRSIFAPALPHLAGIKHVMVVPAGPLQSLPFSMLVASPPPEIKSDADYRQVDWLAKRYAFSVLPSVSSIQAFRQFTKTNTAQEPFAGFGDPLIGATTGTTRGNRRKLNIATMFRNAPVKNAPNAAQATDIADVEAIRNAPRLPETADELRAMAKALKSDQHSLWLQENATETKIKQLDLSKYRTLAFATHGLMAGEIKGIGEAGLILTPPQEGSLEDDGYLSASEIAKLKLNADLVVLSACNTAAADGTPGAEGLSGLAKAFFYAGARSLLVSHWPVASEATVPLTTGMLKEYEANPAQGKAEAHRKAMLALIDTPDHPGYAHPLFWAPFVVVGEGGAGKQIGADKNK